MAAETRVLCELRTICTTLAHALETTTFGHPTFCNGKNAFAVLETYKGELSLALRVEKEHQALFLKDPRFYLTPYIGGKGWVSLRVGGKVSWTEVRGLVEESYRLAGLRKRK
ncbi:MAG: MmcQ/YjbR family DNA-binding protein [Bryobacterales bacterium]|nr:MmcQ/YjbR family DNA-binding protein [Bryobacterales bacterium]